MEEAGIIPLARWGDRMSVPTGHLPEGFTEQF